MLLRIISVEWELYSGKVEKVSFPSAQGIIWVLPGHVNLVTTLVAGTVAYLPDVAWQTSLESFTEKAIKVDIKGGLAMIEDNVITIAAE